MGMKVRMSLKTRPMEQWAMAREARLRIKKAFDAVGIALPSQPVVEHVFPAQKEAADASSAPAPDAAPRAPTDRGDGATSGRTAPT
jgi:small-conductance mechanosensitive channel